MNLSLRDVVILDAQNRSAEVYNLTEHPLGIEANREALKALRQGRTVSSDDAETGENVLLVVNRNSPVSQQIGE